MDVVCKYYNTCNVDMSVISCTGDGFTVTLGDGICSLPPDAHVASLCLRMYFDSCHNLSPSFIHSYVTHGEFTHDVLGREIQFSEFEHHTSLCIPIVDSVPNPSISRVANNVVQHFFSNVQEAHSFGYSKSTFSFESENCAILALAIEKAHRSRSAGDVLSYLAYAMSTTFVSVPLIGEMCYPTYTSESTHLDETMILMGVSQWMDLVQSTTQSVSPGKTQCVWCLKTGTHFVVMIDFMNHHWTRNSIADSSFLIHRNLRDCYLKFSMKALRGGTVEVEFPGWSNTPEKWPWWVGQCIKRVDHRLIECQSTSLKSILSQVDKQHHSSVTDDQVGINTDKQTSTILKVWRRSVECVHTRLCSFVEFSVDTDSSFYSPCQSLLFTRRTSLQEINSAGDIGDIFRSEFGDRFGDEVVARALDNSHLCGCYLVERVEERQIVGAITLFLFDCTMDDGTRGGALLVDSIAVVSQFRRNGIGDNIFLHCCKGIMSRKYSGLSYIIFAQCVRKGGGYRFWFDKLDESSEARSLMYQAYKMNASAIPVQNATLCTPRSRRYYD